MTSHYTNGVFDAVKRHFADPRIAEHLRLSLSSEHTPVSLSPSEAHEALHGTESDPALGAAVWREVIGAAKAETEPQGPWRMLLVWLATPRLNGTAHRITSRLKASRPDIEAEMVLALLETLQTVEPDSPFAAEILIKAARSRAWRFARPSLFLLPVRHIENIAREDDHPGADDQPEAEIPDPREWELEFAPPNSPGGLRAPLRFPVSAAQLEGERLGVLAGRLGLQDIVHQARRGRPRRRVGTLTLRPGGKRR
ncbi:hypothetical protein [Streptomyces chrestomyceticus]|uniref:hypothetical protein n=1 Tax=Streptomyces chrestomyceticus TaxID=68185 RepID=UPI0033BFEAF0